MQAWLTTRFDPETETWDVCRVTTQEGRMPSVDVVMSGYTNEHDAAVFMAQFAAVEKTVSENRVPNE